MLTASMMLLVGLILGTSGLVDVDALRNFLDKEL